MDKGHTAMTTDMTALARKSMKARCLSLAKNTYRMSEPELALLDRLLDEYDRKRKQWARDAAQNGDDQ